MSDFGIMFLLAVVLFIIIGISFVVGVMAGIWSFERDAPDLYAEWMDRRNEGRGAK